METPTYRQLIGNRSIIEVAIALGFCRENSPRKRKLYASARITNWNRTGIPARIMAKKGDIVRALVESGNINE